jgi:hypothetical protein
MTIAVASRGTYLNCAFKPGFWSGDVEPTRFYDPINFTKLEITSQTQESDDLISNMEGSIGELLASVNKPTDSASLSAEANYMPPVMFGLLLGADITELNQVVGSAIVDEAVTLAAGLWTPLANKYIDGTTVVCKTAADATVAAANYTVDTINGLIKANNATGATITKVSYSKAARTGEIYKGGKALSSYVKLIGTGTEKITQKRCRLVIHKASLAGSGAFDPVTGTYVSGAFTGKLITPSTETSPWTYEYLDLAA